MAGTTYRSPLYELTSYKLLFYWFIYFIISDAIQIILIIGSFLVCKTMLYSFAKFKLIATSAILAINMCL